ncbi:MAG: aldo/keto reductase [Desulfomicrobium escambiense]|nr:aldo/keto reductase [Desulfomicrobium escambiense]
MRTRRLGRTGVSVSEIGFGAWAIGGSWGEQKESDSVAALPSRPRPRACTFIDTAAGYGNGRSERIIGKVLKERKEHGRSWPPKTPPAPGPWPPTPYCRDDERYPESYLRANVEERLPQPRHRADRPPAAAHLDARLEPQPAAVRDPAQAPGRGQDPLHRPLDARARPELRHRPDARGLARRRAGDLQRLRAGAGRGAAAGGARRRTSASIVRVVFDEGVLTGKYTKDTTFGEGDFRGATSPGDRLERAVAPHGEGPGGDRGHRASACPRPRSSSRSPTPR